MRQMKTYDEIVANPCRYISILRLYWVSEIEWPQPVRKKGKLVPSRELPKVKDRRLAIVTRGNYEVGGRISNLWNWTYFDDNGMQSEEKASGYPNGHPYVFEEANEFKTQISVQRIE